MEATQIALFAIRRSLINADSALPNTIPGIVFHE